MAEKHTVAVDGDEIMRRVIAVSRTWDAVATAVDSYQDKPSREALIAMFKGLEAHQVELVAMSRTFGFAVQERGYVDS
jgi:hypothetical protein